MSRQEAISLERFRELLDAYGAEPGRWPPGETAGALALVEISAAARDLRDQAARLDALLDLAPSGKPSAGLTERVMAAAPGQAGGVARDQSFPRRGGQRSAASPASHRRRWWRYAAVGIPLAAAAAAAVWFVRVPEPDRYPLSDYQIAQLGTYATPMDALLEPSEIDLIDAVPAFGCAGSELACPDLEDASRPQSRESSQRRIVG